MVSGSPSTMPTFITLSGTTITVGLTADTSTAGTYTLRVTG